ncbi:MAG: hypothetical protein J2P59_05630 [Acidimicrobiales bacterium]|nr:hypothetical protein [Acidimicrobiales bacterium]
MAGAGVTAALLALPAGTAGAFEAHSFLGELQGMTTLSTTVPPNGDVNPYGVAVVPTSIGRLQQGDVLVSNFNDAANEQGTGHTIVELPPGGLPAGTPAPVFADIHLSSAEGCPGGVGLTTALSVLPSGWVVVGSLPTTDGTSATARAGCLIVLNAEGQVVTTIAGNPINGPWDMVATQFGDHAVLFVTNVLNGITPAANAANSVVDGGTVVRVDLGLSGPVPQVESETVIASGFGERTDPDALVIGPTGVGLSQDGRFLYVADSLGNRITLVPAPFFLQGPFFGTGFTVSSGGALNDPLGLAVAPNGDVITVNGNDGNAVETRFGEQVATVPLDTTAMPGAAPGAGTLFGIAIAPDDSGLYFVDDGSNTLNLLGANHHEGMGHGFGQGRFAAPGDDQG